MNDHNSSTPSPTIAVVDVETTGMFPYRGDRVVEIAAVVIDLEGNIVSKFSSLINPQRSVGPTFVHGVRSKDVVNAPKYGEIAGAFLESIHGVIAIGGHNVVFDLDFLNSEFSRMGIELPSFPILCTMELSGGGNLAKCCRNHGITPDGKPHQAMTDATMTAKLLGALLSKRPKLRDSLARQNPIAWPTIPTPQKPPLPRNTPKFKPKSQPTLFDPLENP